MKRSRIKRKPRTPSETLRKYGPPERRAWMKQRPCVICQRRPCDSAHVKSGGTGRKDDYTRTVPMCSTIVAAGYSGHHAEYDGGKESFMARYGLTLDDLLIMAEWTEIGWQYHARLTPIGAIVPGVVAALTPEHSEET